METWIKYEKRFIIKNQFDSIKLQILLYTFSNSIPITDGQMDLLTHLAIHGINKESLSLALTNKIFKSKYSLGNAMTILTKLDLLVVNAKGKKEINSKLDLIINDLLLGNIKVINLNK